MKRSSLVASLIIGMFGIAAIVFSLVRGENTSNTNRTKPYGLRYIESSNRLEFYRSDLHGFSMEVSSAFTFDGNPNRDLVRTTYSFRRINQNTNETPNRDTPNTFNTAADDIFWVRVLPRAEESESLIPYNPELISLLLNSGVAPESGEEFILGKNRGIRTFEADGIESFARNYYLESSDIILVIGSDDVPKDELEAIVASVQFVKN